MTSSQGIDIDLVSEFQGMGISEDDAYMFISAGFWPSEVHGYRSGGVNDLAGMKSLAHQGVSGEVFGALSGVGITDKKEVLALSNAGEDWYLIHTCIKVGLTSFEDLSMVIESDVDSAAINDIYDTFGEVTIAKVVSVAGAMKGLTTRQRRYAVNYTKHVFGDAAKKVLSAHMYPHALVTALGEVVVSTNLFEVAVAEEERAAVIHRVSSLDLEKIRALAILCEGSDHLTYVEVEALLDVLTA